MAFNSLVVQDITYTQVGYTLTALKVTYVNSTALSVVSFDTGVLTVNIVSGTSTATAIVAAVNASTLCNQYLTAAVTGTGSNVQVSAVNALLSGGVTASVAATLTVGPLKITAVTAGTGGNSVRFKFTSGGTAGSEAVTVSVNDITVQIAEGVSTYAQVKTAIAGNGSAAALISTASAGQSLAQVARVSHATAFTNLAGGATAAPAVLVIQGVTITSTTNDATQNSATFTMTTGATAGAEVVTMSGNNISVQIQNGVSTVTQIRTALQAAGSFTAKYTATGTAGTFPLTVNALTLAGATAGGGKEFYLDNTITALTGSFVRFPFGLAARTIILRNDDPSGANKVEFSYDGVTKHGEVRATESLVIDGVEGVAAISMRFATAAPAYRLTVMGR